MRKRTCILPYLKVPKHPVRGTAELELELGNIKGLWKKLIKSGKITKKLEYPSNIEKWDFHSTIFQGPKPPLPGVTHLDTIQTATIWSLELGNTKGL